MESILGTVTVAVALVAGHVRADDYLYAPEGCGYVEQCSASYCTIGCDDCCDGCCCRPSIWRHLRTWIGWGCPCSTGMMYPHYPYAPECHGYYDFAPYNAIVLQEHVILSTALGEPMENPYARYPFPEIYSVYANTDYLGGFGQVVPQLERVEPQLPDLEAVFYGEPELEPVPTGGAPDLPMTPPGVTPPAVPPATVPPGDVAPIPE